MKNILKNNKLFTKKRENLLKEEKDYKSLITRSLTIILALTIVGFFSFAVHEFYQVGIQKEKKEVSISSLEKDIEKLQGLALRNSKVNKSEIARINKEFANKKFVFGLETSTVDIIDKVRVTGTLKYFNINVHFKTKDLNALKKYVALVYLNDKVYKVVDIEKDHLRLIILGV